MKRRREGEPNKEELNESPSGGSALRSEEDRGGETEERRNKGEIKGEGAEEMKREVIRGAERERDEGGETEEV
ncbi:hypothetical protein CgunFtcFv8_004982 [Champsocephalus gunnari]|uniref:Uncharacterized protein n=1 Tax=Champsocephalus gunnari TaxID=52237 RepID=A0AAN8CUQ1_CHAGU|nr:hypothetical protein CgunFtcFv8_004982 [Champsocephalus gunnari]